MLPRRHFEHAAVPVHSMSQPCPTRSRSQPPRMGPKDCPKRSMEPAMPCTVLGVEFEAGVWAWVWVWVWVGVRFRALGLGLGLELGLGCVPA